MTRTTRAAAAVLAAAIVGAAVPAAHAQTGRDTPDARVTIPKPRGEPKATPIMSILTALILSAGLVTITLMPSKRGHQD